MDNDCVAPEMGSRSVRSKSSSSNGRKSPGSPGSGRSSPESNCPICLGKLENKSFTDSCLHQFCFKCLQEWSKVKAECPLCKQSFKSIIHNVRSNEDYDQYNVSISTATTSTGLLRVIMPAREEPFRYRTTAVSSYLNYYVRLEQMMTGVLPVYPGPPRRRPATRSRTTSDFRRNIYQQGLWVQRESGGLESVRESSPEFYRNNPATTHRLVPWLNRELNVLCQPPELVQSAIDAILRQITVVPIRSRSFARAVSLYIGRHTEHFVHEFYSFATSQYDLVGYDRNVTYVNNVAIAPDPITDDDTTDNDDVQVVDPEWVVPPPRRQRLLQDFPIPVQRLSDSSDSDSDDCVVVDTIPPRRADPPEVITLDSSSDEEIRVVDTPPPPSVLASKKLPKPQPGPSRQGSSCLVFTPGPSRAQQEPSRPPTRPSSPTPGPSRPRRALKRNWKIVQNLQVPSTSTSDLSVRIKIDHSYRSDSDSSSSSGRSYSSDRPREKRSTKKKLKKNKDKNKEKGEKEKDKKDKDKSKREKKSKKASSKKPKKELSKRYLNSSDSSSEEDKVERPVMPLKKRKPPVISETESESDALHIDTDFSSYSSDQSDHKSKIRSVVVKSEIKSEVQPLPSPSCSEISVGNYSPLISVGNYSPAWTLPQTSSCRPLSDSDRSGDNSGAETYSKKSWLKSC